MRYRIQVQVIVPTLVQNMESLILLILNKIINHFIQKTIPSRAQFIGNYYVIDIKVIRSLFIFTVIHIFINFVVYANMTYIYLGK